jgi:hypothetical protein
VNRITTSFMDRAMMNQERMAQGLPAISKSDVPRVPNETFYQRQDGVNENLLIGPPDAPATTRTAFTIASEGFFDLDEDIQQVDEWLAAMPAEEEEEASPGPNGIFGVHIHHSLRRNGSDASNTEPEESEDGDATQSMLKKSKSSSQLTDMVSKPSSSTAKPKGKGHKRTASQSFSFGTQGSISMIMRQKKTASNSFSGRPASQLATPSATSPALPPFTFPANASGTAVDQDQDQNESMFVFGGADNAPDGSSSPSPSQLPRHGNGPSVPVPQWLANQQGVDDDEDMPDTDPGEFFSEDAE